MQAIRVKIVKKKTKRVWCSWNSLSKHPHVLNKGINDSLSVNMQREPA